VAVGERVDALQDILTMMEKMKRSVGNKLNNIYQGIIIQNRRRKLKKWKKEHGAGNGQPTNAPTQNDHRRKLFGSSDMSDDAFEMPRSLNLNQNSLFDFGRIDPQEQNFKAMVDPAFPQNHP